MEVLFLNDNLVVDCDWIVNKFGSSEIVNNIKAKGFSDTETDLGLEVYSVSPDLKAIIKEPCSCCGKSIDILELEEFGGMCFHCDEMRFDAMMESYEEDRIEQEDWEEVELD